MTRRELLTALLSTAAGLGAGWVLMRGHRPPPLVKESLVEKEALKAVSEQPGPAVAKLAALGPLRHKAIAMPEPAKANSGLSAETHRLHYEHHYLEYLYRWESNERDFLRAAEALALARGATARDAARAEAVRLHREATAGAMMAVLHTIYWQQIGTAAEPHKAEDIQDLADQLEQLAGGADWLLVTRRWGRAGVEKGMATDIGFLPGEQVLAAIDMASHAWMLDFPSASDYLAVTLQRLDKPTLEIWSQPSARLGNRQEWKGEATVPKALAEILAGAFPSGAAPDHNRVLEGLNILGNGRLPETALLPQYGTVELVFPEGLGMGPALPNIVP